MTDAQVVRHLLRTTPRIGHVDPTMEQTPGDVLGDRARDEMMLRILAEQGDATVEALAEGGIRRHESAAAPHGSSGRSIEARKEAQQARFPRATGATDQQPLGSVEVQVELLEHRLPPAFDVDGIQVHPLVGEDMRGCIDGRIDRRGAAKQSILLRDFEANEGIQCAFTQQRSPSDQR